MIAMVGYLKYNEKKFSNLEKFQKPDIKYNGAILQ